MKSYVLNNAMQPVEASTRECAAFLEQRSRCVVAQTEKDGVRVSTVFLGFDHGFNNQAPILFETMTFPDQEEQERYTTYAAACAGHERHCRRIWGDEPESSA